MIVSRPSAEWNDAEEACTVQQLTEDQVSEILIRALGRPVRFNLFDKLSEPIRNAIRRPLFALLLGAYLRTHNTQLPRSTGELLADMADRAFRVSRIGAADQHHHLQQLAVQIIDNEGSAVSSREFAGRAIVDTLLRSHLVVENKRLLTFSDSIFSHWFAAQALLDGSVSMTGLCHKPGRLRLWTHPLEVAIAQASFEQTVAILKPMIAADIVFATEILQRAVTNWNRPDEVPARSIETFGSQARLAMETWISGLGPLRTIVTPRRRDGQSLWTLGVRIDGSAVHTSWYFGPDIDDELIELPETLTAEWFPVQTVQAVYQAAWVWEWAQREVALFLSALVDYGGLTLPNTLFGHEAAWETANLLLQSSPLFASRISLDAIDVALAKALASTSPPDDRRASLLGAEIKRLRADGQTHMTRPWPMNLQAHEHLFPPGISEGQTQVIAAKLAAEPWSMYTPQGLLVHAHLIYMFALRAYAETVATWFPAMAQWLSINLLRPVSITGVIGMPHQSDPPVPLIGYILSPLESGQGDQVSFTLVTGKQFNEEFAPSREQMSRIFEDIARYRSPHKRWLRATGQSQVLKIFGHLPVTEVAMEWIRSELSRIGWYRRLNETHYEPPPAAIHVDADGHISITIQPEDIVS